MARLTEEESFKFHTVQDLMTLAAGGMSDMLRKQRERREELKTFSKTDPSHTVGDRAMTEEESAFTKTVCTS